MSIPSGTRITLADGTTKLVESLAPGDILLTLNEDSWEIEPAAVVSVVSVEPRSLREIRTPGRRFPATRDHRVMTGFGWLEASELVANDLVAVPSPDALITYEKVSSLGDVSEKPCWALTVAGGNAFVGNGVITSEAV